MKQSLRFTFPWPNSRLNWPLSSREHDSIVDTEADAGRKKGQSDVEKRKREGEKEGKEIDNKVKNLRRCENERDRSHNADEREEMDGLPSRFTLAGIIYGMA